MQNRIVPSEADQEPLRGNTSIKLLGHGVVQALEELVVVGRVEMLDLLCDHGLQLGEAVRVALLAQPVLQLRPHIFNGMSIRGVRGPRQSLEAVGFGEGFQLLHRGMRRVRKVAV